MPASLTHRKRMLEHLERQEKSMDTITDDTWPRHPDGHRKTFGEMTREQKHAVVRGSVDRMKFGPPPPSKHIHNWGPTDNPLIDRCSVCGEERA